MRASGVGLPRKRWQFSLTTLFAVLAIAAFLLGIASWTFRFISQPDWSFAGFLAFLFVRHCPAWLCLFGITVAIQRWRRHPRTSRHVLIGLSIFLFYQTIDVVFSLWALHVMSDPFKMVDQMSRMQGLSRAMIYVRIGAYLLSFPFLVLAVFGDREPSSGC
jgi:hypothetical protein